GMETVDAGVYSRSISVDGQQGWLSVSPGAGDWLEVTVGFPDPAALPEIERRLRDMFDLSADPKGINRQLANDPLMASLVAARPGLRVPGTWDG
ncbi:adenosine deaminase, partial [Salmonella enterica subsp. enterica serovar Indiana]|nr:adenosine deaminase [Salmonella enterica subsp. enterica serovar Indiana]